MTRRVTREATPMRSPDVSSPGRVGASRSAALRAGAPGRVGASPAALRAGAPGCVGASRSAALRAGAPGRCGASRSAARRVLSSERGQSSVELVAVLPLTLLIGIAILTLLAARSASGQAASAAQAGAMALLQDAEPRAAARAALPPDARARSTVRVTAREVTVTVRPATTVGFLADALTARASADAGPPP